jgi:hypothetical protein
MAGREGFAARIATQEGKGAYPQKQNWDKTCPPGK